MRKTVNVLMIAVLFIAGYLMSGCLKDEWEEEKKQEKINRDAYIKSLEDEGYTVIAEDGIYYAIVTEGTGASPTEYDYIIIDFTGTKTDNSIIETTDASRADDWFYYQYYDHYVFGPKKILLGNSIAGFIIGVKKMKEGGRSIIIIPSELGYWRNEYETVIYDTELLKVIKDPVAFDSLQVLSYVNNMTNPVLYKDIYYSEEEAVIDYGDTLTIDAGDSVSVRFNSYYILEDTIILFESNFYDNNALEFIYSPTATAPSEYLPYTNGFLNALDTMYIGTEATVLVPYEQGYQEEGYRHPTYNYIIVPEFTSLVYDILVEDVKKPD